MLTRFVLDKEGCTADNSEFISNVRKMRAMCLYGIYYMNDGCDMASYHGMKCKNVMSRFIPSIVTKLNGCL